jgi:hypothetical protein
MERNGRQKQQQVRGAEGKKLVMEVGGPERGKKAGSGTNQSRGARRGGEGDEGGNERCEGDERDEGDGERRQHPRERNRTMVRDLPPPPEQQEEGEGRPDGGGRRPGGRDERTPSETLVILYTNAQSIINKVNELSVVVADLEPDLILVTETWCNDSITNAYRDTKFNKTFERTELIHVTDEAAVYWCMVNSA